MLLVLMRCISLKRMMKNIFKVLWGFCLLVLVIAGFSGLAMAKESGLFIKYTITISGIPIGDARISSRFDKNIFNIVAHGKTAGVSRLVSDGRATLISKGRLSKGRVLSNQFKMDTVDDKLVTKVRMGMRAGSIQELLALPPLSKRADRIPVKREHHLNVVDPLSAFLVPLDEDGRIKPEKACNRTIAVFDGWQRFDVKLSFKEQRKARLGGRDGYSGPVVVCKARYAPIAGHRPTRKTTVYLQNNEKMEMWLAPVNDLPVLVPVFIKIGTRVGPLSLSASVFTTNLQKASKIHSE